MINDAMMIAKTMKLPYITVTPNLILGSDDNFCMVSVIQTPSEIPRTFSTKMKDLILEDEYKKLINNTNILISDRAKNIYSRLSDEYYIDIANEPMIEFNIRNAFNHANEYIANSELIIDSFDAGNTEEFRSILSMKVSDGHAFYRISEQYIMSFYGSLIAANSSDKIFISIYKKIYKYGEPGSILAKCDVVKKKYTISNYIKYRLL